MIEVDRERLGKARERLLSAVALLDDALIARTPREAHDTLDDAWLDAHKASDEIARAMDALADAVDDGPGEP